MRHGQGRRTLQRHEAHGGERSAATRQSSADRVLRSATDSTVTSPDPDAVLGVEPEAVAWVVPKASWNSSRLRTMLARNSGGLCGSMVRYCSACSLRRLVRQHVGPVEEQPLRAGAVDRSAARRPRGDQRRPCGAMVRPPRSPMFSPTVSAPLTCSPGRSRGSKPSYCSISALRLHLEGGLVVGGPPVVEVAGAVVLRALVVEAVADLVADHRADAAVVLGRVGVGRRRTASAGCRPGSRSRWCPGCSRR